MLKDTNKMLRVSNASLDWHAYIDFINNIVVDGADSASVSERFRTSSSRRWRQRDFPSP